MRDKINTHALIIKKGGEISCIEVITFRKGGQYISANPVGEMQLHTSSISSLP